MQVTKLDGKTEEYSEDKIRASAGRVGVPNNLQEAMLKEIRSKLYDGVKTSEIFDTIKNYLRQTGNADLGSKYNLKAALTELGPSGYPFEKFVAAVLTELGYSTTVGQTLPGKCVTHEVDVVATKDQATYFVEAKFHKNVAQRSDIKVPLYIYARYLDLASRQTGKTFPWIFTNTRFSTDAVSYAQCQQIRLTSWSYPKGEGLRDLIEKTQLHPITMLDGLTAEDKRRLTELGIVTCRQFASAQGLENIIDASRLQAVRQIAIKVCKS